MDWMHGEHISQFAAKNQDPELANEIGQTLWNFYMYQIHELNELEILRKDDSAEEIKFFKKMFHDMLELFTEPLQNETFDFSRKEYFERLAQLGEHYAKGTELRKMNGNRGSRHFIYMNRTFFGLYHLLSELKATNIRVKNIRKAA